MATNKLFTTALIESAVVCADAMSVPVLKKMNKKYCFMQMSLYYKLPFTLQKGATIYINSLPG